MVSMIDCGAYSAGVNNLACISQQTDYLVGHAFLLLIVALIFFRLNNEPTRDRLTATMFVASLVTGMGAVNNMLFPNQYFIVAIVLFLGSLALLANRK